MQANRVSQSDGSGDSSFSQQLGDVKQQVDQVKGENDDLRSFFQEALQARAAAASPKSV